MGRIQAAIEYFNSTLVRLKLETIDLYEMLY